MTATMIGYARCSTDEQDLTAQRQLLLGLGVAPDRIYLDHGVTGTTRNRPGLDQALAAVRAGDTLVVPKLDRLARSVPDARAIGDSLVARGVKLSLGGTVYDPTDPMGKLFFNILPPLPSSRSTCYACAPARAWPSLAPRAGCAASSPR
jgi:DNA invertase Pin-like site-specific DNA recombinase